MEEDIRKKGMLYLQQQRFGKKWKRVCCVLYRESTCSISRLEFYECKDGGSEKNDKNLRKQQEHKKVIRLSDCIRVSEVDMDGCPKDTSPFLIETSDKIYVFAAERQQVDDWTHKLCEIAFPMNWVEPGVKRGSLHRGTRVDEDQGMEDNSLYSGRDTVRVFRVCIRRTEASDRCRLKGDVILRADVDALHLLDRGGDVVYTWPYRYLRRFGRDKSTFSFEAGRRCESGEGSFEFDTKQGNVLFQVVEANINLQRTAHPLRQTSEGPDTPLLSLTPPLLQTRMPPLPQPRSHIPQAPAAQEVDGVYSTVNDPTLPVSHHKDAEGSAPLPQQQQQRPHLSRLEPPVDKALTGVRSLTLDARGLPVPSKNRVKTISSCPLPHAGPDPTPNPGSAHKIPDQTYSQINLVPGADRGTRRDKRGGASAPAPPPVGQESEYSLPFDLIASAVMADLLKLPQAPPTAEAGADPLYDSIDEMKIRNVFLSEADAVAATYRKVEHIYDEPEGCAAPGPPGPASVYDDPEEMKGDAWRIMGTPGDPKGHEYPYNPRVDDYAVPKRPQRALHTASANEEEQEAGPLQEEEGEGEGEDKGVEQQDSPYNNVMVKMA